MRYRTIPNTGLEVSTVALGTWAIGGSNWGQVDDRNSIAAIRRAVDEGVNLIDTAPVYGKGHAEEVVGQALKGIEHNVIVSTKCGLLIDQGNRRSLRPGDMRREVDDSLRRLDIDVIDLLFCHWPDQETPIEETMGEMLRLREKGKIRYFGLSNHGSQLVERARSAAPVCCLQEHYSLLRRDVEAELLPLSTKAGMGVLAYAPLGGGILTGKYTSKPQFGKRDVRTFFYPFFKEPFWSRTQSLLDEMRAVAEAHGASVAAVAIAWVSGQEGVTSCLVGAKSEEQAAANAEAGDLALTPEEMRRLRTASDTLFSEETAA